MDSNSMQMIYLLAAALGGVLVGGGLAWFLYSSVLTRKKNSILDEATKEGETIKEKKVLQAKERFLEMKSQHEREVSDRNKKIQQVEDRLKNRERELSQQLEQTKRKEKDIENQKENLSKLTEINQKKQSDLDKAHQKAVTLLEEVAGISPEDAKNQLMEQLKDEARNMAASQIQGIVDEARLTANTEAKKIVIQTIQRTAVEHAIENSVSVFNIENDEMKGRIIGREGRNIRALEAATGVEIIVDDTPEAIVLSCFDPVRRETARLSPAPIGNGWQDSPGTHRRGGGQGEKEHRRRNCRSR